MFTKLKQSITEKSHKYEIHLTCILIIVAIILLAIACFGEPEHKAIAVITIVI
jgi:hypothetical protein